MLNRVALGKRVQMYRESKELTLNEVAEACGVTAAHMRQIEASTKLPSLPMFVMLCSVLGVSANILLQESLGEIQLDNTNDFVCPMEGLKPEYHELVSEIIQVFVQKQKEDFSEKK